MQLLTSNDTKNVIFIYCWKLKEEKFGGYVVGINGKHLGIQIKDVFLDGTIWTDTGEKKLKHILSTTTRKITYPALLGRFIFRNLIKTLKKF